MGSFFSRVSKNKYDVPDRASNGVVVEPEISTKSIVDLGDIDIEIDDSGKDIATYCLPLLETRFWGETSSEGHTDEASVSEVLNLGLYLSLLDRFLKQFENVTDFTGTEEEYQHLLRLVAMKRGKEKEDTEECYKRLQADSKRFVQIYHKRGVQSEKLHQKHKAYWGSRQQLLSAKVIADWIDKENGPMDPLFGVLLQPTTGRVGPGDTGWLHDILFDDTGYMAYHSAVHDAFGYLINYHKTGPGYAYLGDSYLDTDNPMAGQLSGIAFWQKVLNDVETKQKVIKYLSL